MLAGLFILGLLVYGYWFKFYLPDEPFADKFWEFFEPVSAIMTLIVTVLILYFQAYKRWEDSLEKRMTVYYDFIGQDENKTIAIIKEAYLASEDDIRSWAQSLGSQIFGRFDFDMYWDEEQRPTLKDGKKWYRQYTIRLFLTQNPIEDDEKRKELQKFLNKRFKYSTISGDLDNLPILWSRRRNIIDIDDARDDLRT